MVSTLVRASLDGALLVVAVWVLSRLLRLTPATRTLLWWCAAAKFVVALAWTTPIAIPVLPATSTPTENSCRSSRVRRVHAASAAVLPRRSTVATGGANANRRIRRSASRVVVFAAIGWSLGVFVALVVLLRRSVDTRRARHVSEPASAALQAHAIDLASRLRLRRVPDVRTSHRVETPLVTGLMRPVVLLPVDRFDGLSDRQQQMALCHELVHVKRADLWLGCVPALAERVFFFHPLAHLASREYALAREAACDAAVIETLDVAPQEYGRLLLALGVSPPRVGLTPAGAAWSFSSLKRRIAMLQDVSTRRKRSRLFAAATVGLAVAGMVPMQLTARPASGPVSSRAEGVGQERPVDVRASGAPVPSEPADSVEMADTGERQDPQVESTSRGLNFVLLLEDDQQTTYGLSADVARAKRYQRAGESLLWFQRDGREYVIRDPELVRQARALWAEAYDSRLDLRAIAAMAEAFNSDALVDYARLAAEQATHGAELGAMAAEQASRALAEAGAVMPDISRELEKHRQAFEAHRQEKDAMAANEKMHALEGHRQALEQHRQSLELQRQEKDAMAAEAKMQALEQKREALDEHRQSLELQRHAMEALTNDKKVHELEHRFKQDMDGQLKQFEQNMRALEGPLHELSAPMEELGRRMEGLGGQIEAATRDASERMRALLDRALAAGLAQTVR